MKVWWKIDKKVVGKDNKKKWESWDMILENEHWELGILKFKNLSVVSLWFWKIIRQNLNVSYFILLSHGKLL